MYYTIEFVGISKDLRRELLKMLAKALYSKRRSIAATAMQLSRAFAELSHSKESRPTLPYLLRIK